MKHAEARARNRAIAEYAKKHPTLTMTDLALVHGVSISTVRYALAMNAVSAAPSPRKHASNYKLIAKILKAKSTAAEIASELGVTRERVYQVANNLAKYGLNVPFNLKRNRP